MPIPRPRSSALALCIAILIVPAATATADFSDPTGDTFGTSSVQIDITSYNATYSGGNTTFTIGFAGPISAASAFAANSLYGFIDLDLDRNVGTGGYASFPGATTDLPGGDNWINYYIAQGRPGPTIATGDEAFVDLGSEANHAGMVDVISTSTNSILSTVAITYGSNSVSLTIPLVGSGGNSALGFDLLVGTSSELTDRASNGSTADLSTPLSVVPEPSSLTLLGLGVLASGFALARSKAASRP